MWRHQWLYACQTVNFTLTPALDGGEKKCLCVCTVDFFIERLSSCSVFFYWQHFVLILSVFVILLFIMNHLLVSMCFCLFLLTLKRASVIFLQVQKSISNTVNHFFLSNTFFVNTVMCFAGWCQIKRRTLSFKINHLRTCYHRLREWSNKILTRDKCLIVSDLLNMFNLCTAVLTW